MTLTKENGTRSCIICDRWQSVFVFIEDMTTSTEGVCQACIDDARGPGRFESYGDDDEQLATVILLDAWSLRQLEDDYMNNNGDYCGLLSNYLLFHNSQGFVSYEKYDTEEKARETYDAYFASGWGATEFDIYVNYGWDVKIYDSETDKAVPLWPNKAGEITERRIDAALNLYCSKTGCYPNVWNAEARGIMQLRKWRTISWL